MFKKKIKIVLSIFITLFTIYFVAKYININDIYAIYNTISLSTILKAFIIYYFIYILRALRFRELLKHYDVKIKDLIYTSIVHGFYNRILPVRTGELSFVYLTKKRNNIDINMGVETIILARLYDLTSISILFLFSIIFSGYFYNYSKTLIIIVIVMLILSTIFCLYFKFFIKFIKYILKHLNIFNKFSEGNRNKLNNRIDEGTTKYKSFIILNIISIGQWILLYFVFYILLKDISSTFTYSKVMLGSVYSNITNTIPASGVGGFGTMEAGWVLGFSILGFDKTFAFKTGFLINVITFIIIVIFGIFAILYDKIVKRMKK